MDGFKVVYLKCDDLSAAVEKLKGIMQEYDMHLKGIDGNKYVFSRDRTYSRYFVIESVPNGWVTIIDEDQARAEELCMELSQAIPCYSVCMGILNDVMYYTIFNRGEQAGQYMSSLEYYEYPVDDDVKDAFKGNAEDFSEVIDHEGIARLRQVLDDCRDNGMDAQQAYKTVLNIIGIVPDEDEEEEPEDDFEEDAEAVMDPDIFYVDFESINMKADSLDDVLDAVEKAVNELGYKKVDEFRDDSGSKKGLFKKLRDSVIESRRVTFYISPLSQGWVTLVGELERLHGSQAEDWEFLHVEGRLSQIADRPVINIFANSEVWGYRIFRDGKLISSYGSDSGISQGEDIDEVFPGMDGKGLGGVMEREVVGAQDINDAFEEFCSITGIRNYRINIPMDYSEQEYYQGVISSLPDGEGFVAVKFEEDK